MKKLFALLAVVLGVVSCMKDQSFEAGLVGDGNYVLTVALPEAATRAAGSDSAKGAIGNISLNEYDIRYTLEVYDANGDLAKRDQQFSDDTSVSFALRLIPGRDYSFVVWADFVTEGTETDLHYDVADLCEVKLVGDHNAMDESRDAYTAVKLVEGFNSTSTIKMELTRPFAKLRVVTNDMDEIYTTLQSATVKYTTPIYTTFDALTETAGDLVPGVEKSINFTEDAYLYAGEPKNGEEQTLFADYLFGAKNGVVMFTLDVADDVQALPQVTFNTNIPVERNHLTTIYGPVLTDANNISVEIKDAFAKPDNWVFEAFVNGGEVTLDKDYEIGSTLYVEADAVLNLNGYSIKNEKENKLTDVIVVKEGAKLTINGNGTIEAVTGNDGYAVICEGELVINGGTYKSGVDTNGEPNAVIYARGNGAVYVNGGTFPNDNNSKYVLNKKDADRGTTTIEVRGGTFKNFDPANNAAENPGTNFVANGYLSLANGEYFTVIKGVVVDNLDDFKAALNDVAAENIFVDAAISNGDSNSFIFNNDVTLHMANGQLRAGGYTQKAYGYMVNADVTVNNANIYGGGAAVYGSLTLNGGSIYTKYPSSGRYMFYVAGGTVTINDGDYFVDQTGCRHFYTQNGGVVYINGGHFHKAMANDANKDILAANGSNIVITGGTFTGINPSEWVAPGYQAVKSGSTWTVVAE